MPEELRGKGLRVVGYFVWMLGAGVLLDGTWTGAGKVLLAIGLAIFVIGVWQSANPARRQV